MKILLLSILAGMALGRLSQDDEDVARRLPATDCDVDDLKPLVSNDGKRLKLWYVGSSSHGMSCFVPPA